MSKLARPAVARGVLGGLKSMNWGGLLSNAQKTLGVINQTIPIVYQVKPMINNARTMFKIANTLKEDKPVTNIPNNNIQETVPSQSSSIEDSGKPIFFI